MGIKLTHEYTSLSKMGGWAVNVFHLVEYLAPMREFLGSTPEQQELGVVVFTCNLCTRWVKGGIMGCWLSSVVYRFKASLSEISYLNNDKSQAEFSECCEPLPFHPYL